MSLKFVVKTASVLISQGVVLQRTARNYSKVHVARAARLYLFLAQPIKFFIYGVVVDVVDAKAP